MLIADLLALIDRRFPLDAAAPWDPVGLQLGGPGRRVDAVGVCHEITGDVVSRALDAGYDTLIAYHPMLFTPTTSFIDEPGPEGNALRLAAAGVSVIVVHTAYDAASPGTGDALLDALFGAGGFTPAGVLVDPDDEVGTPIGRIASLGAPIGADELLDQVRSVLDTEVRSTARTEAVARVAVVPGSGGSFVEAAASRADALITGDVSHHRARRASDLGLMVVDAGHVGTERPGVAALYSAILGDVPGAELVESDPNPWEG